LIALEVAQQLAAAGKEVALVVMIQSMPPHARRFKASVPWLQRGWFRSDKRLRLEAENLSHGGRKYFARRCRDLWDRSLARFTIAMDDFAGSRGSKTKNRSGLYLFESLGIEHKKAMEKYVPRPYAGDAIVFRASEQLAGLVSDEHLGWGELLRGNFEVCEVPGHQQNLMLEPNVAQLADALKERLKAVHPECGVVVQ
jgi:thioesterase domain-containing protein